MGSEGLTSALADAPCGCDLTIESNDARDDAERGLMLADAAAACARWRCPRAGYPEPTAASTPPDEDEVLTETLVAVGRLTGFRGAKTCPLWYARQPWVTRAVEAFAWRKCGSLTAIEDPVSSVLADAVGAVASGLAERERYEIKQAQEKALRPPDATPAALPTPPARGSSDW